MKYYEITTVRPRVKPVTLKKYVAEYEQMWKWMVKFLSRFDGRCIKIDIVNLIPIAKSMIFHNILYAVAACDITLVAMQV